jgi:hypothetical protein
LEERESTDQHADDSHECMWAHVAHYVSTERGGQKAADDQGRDVLDMSHPQLDEECGRDGYSYEEFRRID